jgi:opacity protein-like surface antigen
VKKIALLTALLASGAAFADRYDRSDDTRSRVPASVTLNRDWGIDFAGGATLNRGNVNKTVENAKFDAFWRQGRFTPYLTAGYEYGDLSNLVYMQKANVIGRVDYQLTEQWRVFAISTQGYNYFLKIAYRTTDGIGPWYDWTLGPVKSSSSLALAYEYEKYRGFPSDYFYRLPFRQVSTWEFSETASLGIDFFFSPVVTIPSNYRIYFGPFLEGKLVDDFLSLRVQLALDYDSRPRPGVVATDTETYLSLVFHFGDKKDPARPGGGT